MKVQREHFHNLKDLPTDEQMTPGSSLCAGCGALEVLRLMLNVLGERVVVVNAAGCLSLLAVYPYTPLRCSWLYTTMASAPAGAQGVRDALDVLIQKGRLPAEDDLQVLVVAGDGATVDIGLSSASGAIHRGLDFFYLCYDNEAFANTGFQMSGASPRGAATATSHATPRCAIGTAQSKKNLFAIWQAHCPPYAATVSTADPLDLADKVRRASALRGPKLFHALAVCPTGWGHEPALSHRIARLAVDTGAWPLKEALHGRVRHTYIPDRRRPVEDYLRAQRRFEHLFTPERRDEVLRQIQSEVDAYWQDVIMQEVAAPVG